MSSIKLHNLITNNFSLDEIKLLTIAIGLDTDNICPTGQSKMSCAINLIQSASNRGHTLKLLDTIYNQRPHLPLYDYLHLLMGLQSYFPSDEVREMYKAIYANEDGTFTVTNTVEQANQIQAHYKNNNNEDAFYDIIVEKLPFVADYPFLKPGYKPPIAPPPTISKQPSQQQQPTDPTPQEQQDDNAFVNFDITINPKQGDDTYYISASVSDGRANENVIPATLPTDEDTAVTLELLQSLTVEDIDMEPLGEKLYQFLFPTEINNLYLQAKEKHDKLRIRILIRAESNELHQLPWEYIRNAQGYIATNKDTPVVRYLPLTRPEETLSTPKPLRILVAMASPSDQTTFDTDEEEAQIRDALAKLEEDGTVELKVIKNTSRRSLRVAFTDFKPHIFHFIGHGGHNERGEGALALESRRGTTQLVDAEDMMALVQNSDSTRLVILAACQTTQATDIPEGHKRNAGFLGMGPRIVWAGVPAVIAMQTVVPMDTAFVFVQEIYANMARGHSLDQAVTMARFAVFFDEDDKVYWGIPVLFMRSPDGNIW